MDSSLLEGKVTRVQVSRLFEIVYLLMRRESVSAGELAQYFEVSTRTIYRDIDTLSGAGIPIYAARGKGGGIRLMPEFVLNRSWFSLDEQHNILAAVQSLSATKLPEADAALHKLAGLFRQDTAPWVAVDFSDWGERNRNRMELVKTAILQRKVIAFVYYNAANERIRRRAEPQQLWFKHRAWYLRAYCLERQGYRLFKLTRMRDVDLTAEPCTHPPAPEELPAAPPPSPKEAAAQGGLPPTGASPPVLELRLHISATAAYRVYDEFDEEQITRNADGSFTVAAGFIEDDWMYGYLLSFGTDAVVTAPPRVRELLRKKTAAMHKLYL